MLKDTKYILNYLNIPYGINAEELFIACSKSKEPMQLLKWIRTRPTPWYDGKLSILDEMLDSLILSENSRISSDQWILLVKDYYAE